MTATSLTETELDAARYSLERKLGQGSAGSVHLAKDRETGEYVALKRLSRMDAKSVLRFKREFRALADMNHPNLVKLYDLGRAEDGWILTMEFLDGTDLLSHIRGARAPEATTTLEPERLARVMSAFYQLTCGVRALHRAGMVHRDLKPSNVMVAQGRVVVLDFGLVRELDDEAALVTEDGMVSGTPAYMAPEQALGKELSEASDWYAFGVMLFQALSGELPFDGGTFEVLRAKLEHDPPHLSTLVADLPPRLVELCTALLRREPADRPRGDEILAVLEPSPVRDEVHDTADTQLRAAAELFGREAELAQLQAALERVEDNHALVMHVRGTSGSGKTALVEFFLDGVVEQSSAPGRLDPLVLRSRCYEREAMPFKALDGLIDALTRHFALLDDVEVGHLLPADVGALARVFPVLQRLSAVQRLTAGAALLGDALQDRQRAETALRELCERLARRKALVMWIDDLHWGDLDSARILKSWLEQLVNVPVLLILTYRSDEITTNSCLQLLLDKHGETTGALAEERLLPVTALANTDIHALCRRDLGRFAHAHADVIERIVREAQGSPFLASQLAALARVKITRGDTDLDALSIDALLAQYGTLLQEPARHTLTVLAVAGRPMPVKLALQAAGVREDGRAVVHALRGLHLVRTRSIGGERLLEIYHDRVRDRVQGALSAAQRERLSADLLRAVEWSGQADPDWLHVLALGANQRDAALHHARAAAKRARATLAFERSAELLAECLELSDPAAADSCELWRELALALACCGRGVKAAEAYIEAAKLAPAEQTLELTRMAASHLLRSGRFEEGEILVQRVLDGMQLRVPATERGLIAALLWEIARLRMRGMSYVTRREQDVPVRLLEQVDVFETLRAETQAHDPLRSALFQARSFRLALEAGEPTRVLRGLCGAANIESVSGSPQSARRVDELLGRAHVLAEQLGTERERARVFAARSVTAFMLGRPADVIAPSYEAERIYRANPAADALGDYYSRFSVLSARVGALHVMGERRRFIAELQGVMQEAIATDNRNAQLSLMLNQTVAEEIHGTTASSRARLDTLLAELPVGRFGLLHVLHMVAVMRVGCTTRQFDWALEYLRGRWEMYQRSPIHRTAFLAVIARATHARLVLDWYTLAARDQDPHALVRADLRALGKISLVFAEPSRLRCRARLAALDGRPEQAIEHLRAACQQYEGAGALEEVARCRFGLGVLLGGDEGRALQAAAEHWLREGGSAEPLAELRGNYPELCS